MADWIAMHMNLMTSAASKGLSVVNFLHIVLGTKIMQSFSRGVRRLSGNRIPMWNPFMSKGDSAIRQNNTMSSSNPSKVVYFPSCINRSMGVSRDHNDELQLSDKMVKLLNKGGYEVIYPDNLNNLCCGHSQAKVI